VQVGPRRQLGADRVREGKVDQSFWSGGWRLATAPFAGQLGDRASVVRRTVCYPCKELIDTGSSTAVLIN